MENWDNEMQIECAKSFQREDVVQYMTPENHMKLMDECLNVIMNSEITQEDYLRHWMKVFHAVCPYLSIEYLRYTVLKRIGDLPSLKQTLPWRKLGFEMFWSITLGKGQEILQLEPLMMRTIHSMCNDNNWKIRRDAAKQMQEFFTEL